MKPTIPPYHVVVDSFTSNTPDHDYAFPCWYEVHVWLHKRPDGSKYVRKVTGRSFMLHNGAKRFITLSDRLIQCSPETLTSKPYLGTPTKPGSWQTAALKTLKRLLWKS